MEPIASVMPDQFLALSELDSLRGQLHWSMLRLCQMQGGQIDPMHLKGGLEQLRAQQTAFQAVATLSKFLGKEPPRKLQLPDRALLPMLAVHKERGWGVVTNCSATGQWLVQTPEGPIEASSDDLRGHCIVLQLGPRVRLGLGLFGMTDEAQTFYGKVRSTLMLYRRELFEAALASLFIGVLALVTSLFSMQVYDRVIPTRGEHTLIVLGLGVVLCILTELCMKYARSHIMDFVVVGVDNRLSREIFDRLLQLRVDQVPNSVGSLASQLRGYEQVRSFYTASTLFTLIDLPLALFFMVVIALIASPWLSIVPLVFALLAIATGVTIRKKVMTLARDGAALSNLKTGLLVEAVEGIETIKSGSGGWRFLSRWVDVNGQTIHTDLKSRKATESMGYISATLQQLSYALLVVVGAILVMQGHMTQGALIASTILGGRISTPIMAIPSLLVQYAHAKAALEGLEKLYLLKTDHQSDEAPLVPESLLGNYELLDVKFSYADNPPSIIVPKLSIRSGERIVVLGPIGAGKSSLLRLLSGLYQPQEGQLLLDGLALSQIHRQIVNQRVGYLQQDHRLFQGTLRENLLIGLPDPGDEVLLKAMRSTGMDRFVSGHPKGLARPIFEGGKGLSGGQKQLLAFTRLMLCQPSVYLLDEPTATMDEEQEKQCLQQLTSLAKEDKTMVIVTHKEALLPLATRIVVIIGNRIVLDGPRDSVLRQLQSVQPRQADASMPSQPAHKPSPAPMV